MELKEFNEELYIVYMSIVICKKGKKFSESSLFMSEVEYQFFEEKDDFIQFLDMDEVISNDIMEGEDFIFDKTFYAIPKERIRVSPLFLLGDPDLCGYQFFKADHLEKSDFDIFIADDYNFLKTDVLKLIKHLQTKYPDLEDLNRINISTIWKLQPYESSSYYYEPTTDHYMEYQGLIDPDKIQQGFFT